MRKIIVILSTISLLGCSGLKVVPKEERKIEKIFEVDGKNKKELYVAVNSWFVENFKNRKSVIQFQDKENGKVMGKYVFNYKTTCFLSTKNTWYKQLISVDIKDGKARFIIKNPQYKIDNDYYRATRRKHIEKLKPKWKNLSTSFGMYINKDDDW